MSEQMNPEQRLIRFAELLQAFRSTLAKPEQELLDQMVAGIRVDYDVEAHVLKPEFVVHPAAVNAVVNPAVSLAAAAAREEDDIEDVAAHGMEQRPIRPTFEFKVIQGVISLSKYPAAQPPNPAVAEGL